MLLDGDYRAVAQARDFTRGWTTMRDLPPDRSRDIALIVSELVTNAIRHAQPPFVVNLSCKDGVVHGDVLDASSLEPHLTDHADEHGGFGLRIVGRLSTRWGCTLEDVGKRVWFELSVP
jgi:anti-sigma regulatory factor (Ser/Thr protein kinase)